MFSSVTSDVVGFRSSWMTDKDLSEKGVQANVSIEDKGNQSKSSDNVEVQTENVQTHETTDFDMEKLSKFLSRVTPSVLDELDKIERSKAFTFYQTDTHSDETDAVRELFRLSSKDPLKLENVVVTNMSWSCTGNVIAVSYGTLHHPEWCSHEAAVFFYNINKYDFDGTTPSRIITTKSCVTALACHPYEPSVVSVGTYNGEVLIWNLQKEDEDVNFENSTFHQDKVTGMIWVTINSQLQLFTSSLDGFIFAFKVSPNLGSVILTDRFTFPEITGGLKMGITSFSFSSGQQGIFITGLEGGRLFHCSALAAITTSRPGSSLSTKDPTIKKFSDQGGPIVSIAFSKHEHHIFTIATAEKKFVIYSLNEVAPLFEIWADFEVTGLEWSPHQANALLVWGLSTQVIVYDGNNGKILEKLEAERFNMRGKRISVASCNNKSPKLLAVGSGDGEASIWEVPQYFK